MITQGTKSLVDRLLDKPYWEYEKFHNKTKIRKVGKQVTHHLPKEWIDISYKSYPRLSNIILPPIQNLSVLLKNALAERTSNRDFGEKPITIETLSTFLFYVSGIKNEEKHSRFYPSAGARYPIETYCILLNTDVPKGVYHYNVKNHSLELLLSFSTFSCKLYFSEPLIQKAGCILLLTSIFNRTTIKYGERGYRHILQEVGAMTQTAYLVASAKSLPICVMGGYNDNKLHTLLDIDGLHEAIVGVVVCGEKQ